MARQLFPNGAQESRLAIPNSEWISLGVIEIGSAHIFKLGTQNGYVRFALQYEDVPLDGHILSLNIIEISGDQDLRAMALLGAISNNVTELLLEVNSFIGPLVDLVATVESSSNLTDIALVAGLPSAVFVPPTPENTGGDIEVFGLPAYRVAKYRQPFAPAVLTFSESGFLSTNTPLEHGVVQTIGTQGHLSLFNCTITRLGFSNEMNPTGAELELVINGVVAATITLSGAYNESFALGVPLAIDDLLQIRRNGVAAVENPRKTIITLLLEN
jgi:hypothetical protein